MSKVQPPLPFHAADVPEPEPEPPTMTVTEAAALLGIGRSTAYEAVREGSIPSLRFRRRIVVPRAAIERMLD